jgi:hypothetical protein
MSIELSNPRRFADDFIGVYLSQGFQSLGKRDVDLLVFLLLERDGALKRSDSNFDIGRELRLTPAKVRTLRREAYARWRPLLEKTTSKEQLKSVLADALTESKIEAGARYASAHNKASGYLAIRLEHPDDREVLERALLDRGEIPAYERNPEVLVIAFGSLLDLAQTNRFVTDPQKVYSALKRLAPTSDKLQDILTADIKDLNWRDVREAFNLVGAQLITKSIDDINVTKLLKLAFPFLPSS